MNPSELESLEADPADSPTPGPSDRLIEGPVAATLIRFAIPLLLSNLLGALSGTWGAVWVSHVLGPNALTAVTNVNIFMGMMNGAVMGVGSAAGIAVGQAIGAADASMTRRVAATSVTFAIGASSLFALLTLIFAPAILNLIHMPAVAFDEAVTFFRITALSMPPAFTFIFLMMLMRGTGDSRTPFNFTLVSIVVGLVATPLLLTGALGLPRLGIAGAAWSGVLANLIALAGMIAYIYWKDLPLAFKGEDLKLFRPDPALLWMLVQRGTPMAMETFIVQGAYFVLLTMVNAQGAATAAAYAGAASLWGYVQMPSGALAASMSAMAAMSIGAKRWDRVEQVALKGCIVAGSLTLTAAALVYGLGVVPLKLLLPRGGEELEIARHINHIVLWGWIVLAVTSGLSAMVRANAAMLAPTLIYATTMWVLRVPFAHFMQPILGPSAIWWSFPVGSVSSALLAFAYYRWGNWRANKLMVQGVGGR